MKTRSASPPPLVVSKTISFPDATKVAWWRQSSSGSAQLRARELTERELIEAALELRPDLPLKEFVREGALALAREVVRRANAGSRSLGSGDSRIAAAAAAIRRENVRRERKGMRPKAITPSTLAVAAKTNRHATRRYLAAHPEGA